MDRRHHHPPLEGKPAAPAKGAACSAHHAAPKPPAAAAPVTGVKYTCPMHPQVVRDAPGSCPICGMALEPMTPSAEQGESAELKDMTRRFWISAALTVPLLWLLVGEVVPAIDPMRLMDPAVVAWAQLLLATPVVLWGGWPLFRRHRH